MDNNALVIFVAVVIGVVFLGLIIFLFTIFSIKKAVKNLMVEYLPDDVDLAEIKVNIKKIIHLILKKVESKLSSTTSKDNHLKK